MNGGEVGLFLGCGELAPGGDGQYWDWRSGYALGGVTILVALVDWYRKGLNMLQEWQVLSRVWQERSSLVG